MTLGEHLCLFTEEKSILCILTIILKGVLSSKQG